MSGDGKASKPSTEWERWVEAAKILGADPTAKVRCPRHDDDFLEVIDVPLPGRPGRVERHLRCPTCGAYNSILNPTGFADPGAGPVRR